MKIQESGEMYLETILILSRKGEPVRSIDVDKDGHITLTDVGEELATKIYERHNILTKFLISIGVDEGTAASDACKMEHVMSDITLEAIKKQLK